jgi:ketosteroid isomerase-like protein
MSQENVEIVKALYEGWERGDFSAEAHRYDPDIEFTFDLGPDLFTARGTSEMRQVWADHLRLWRHWSTGRIHELIDADPHVVAISPIRARGRHSGVPVEVDSAAAVFTFRDGRIIQFAVSNSLQNALEAIGLSEEDLKQAE